MRKPLPTWFLPLTLATVACGGKEPAEECQPVEPLDPADYAPEIDPANFVATIDNPWWPLTPGTTFVYEGTDEGEQIHDEQEVLTETRVVMGVTCTVVRDTEDVDGELAEDTRDWFAQDVDGNVWYFGEDTAEYEEGEIVSTHGSWEGGVDGALPGIIMPADPSVGDPAYRQEYYAGEAEDTGQVTDAGVTVTGPYGSWTDTIVTRETNPLEPCVDENKYYARDVGLVRVDALHGGDELVDLVDILTE